MYFKDLNPKGQKIQRQRGRIRNPEKRLHKITQDEEKLALVFRTLIEFHLEDRVPKVDSHRIYIFYFVREGREVRA